MTFPRLRQPGMWLLGSVLEPQECEQIDNELTYALDGLNGGSYSPYAPIVLGASAPNTKGLWVQSLLEADHLQGTVSAGLTLTVATGGQIDVEGEILVSGQQSAAASIQFGAYANLIFTSGQSEAIWDAGAVASFLAGAGFQMAGIGTVNGSSGTPATWTWGPNSSQTLDGSATVADLATHKNFGGQWTFTGNAISLFGATLAADNATQVTLAGPTALNNANTTLGMVPPAPTDATGINKLLSTLQVKSWANIRLVQGSVPALRDGCNVAGAGIDINNNLSVAWATQFANASYAAFALYSDGLGQTTGVGYPVFPAQSSASFVFIQLAANSGGPNGPGTLLNMNLQTGTIWVIAIGRQS